MLRRLLYSYNREFVINQGYEKDVNEQVDEEGGPVRLAPEGDVAEEYPVKRVRGRRRVCCRNLYPLTLILSRKGRGNWFQEHPI